MKEGTVYMSPELAQKCNIYHGDPRGPEISRECKPDEDVADYLSMVLLRYGRNVLHGADNDYICISTYDYEEVLRKLSSMKNNKA